MALPSTLFEITTNCCALGGVPESRVVVDFSAVYNRCAHDTLEATVEEEWARRRTCNPRLFNASKFRYHGITPGPAGNIVVHLGLTDYREFIGTNMSPHASRLLADGLAQHGSSDAFMVRVRCCGCCSCSTELHDP
jgi:hypothetical protein